MAFDYRTEIRNAKGTIVSRQPYRMKITKSGTTLERPPGSGVLYNPDGTVVDEKMLVEWEKKSAEKKNAVSKSSREKSLEKELDALRKENESLKGIVNETKDKTSTI